jgi:hypothetical protein
MLRRIELEELPQLTLHWHSTCIVAEVTDQNSSTSHTIKYPYWQREFEAALREGDPESLRQRVDAAEAALFLRLQALVGSAEEHDERQAISDAMKTLRAIQREKLGYPEFNTK